jgi:hypothetical protein
MNVKIEAGAQVQITDKPIVNIFGDVVQRKEIHFHSEEERQDNEDTEAEYEESEEVKDVEQPKPEDIRTSVATISGVKPSKLDTKTPEAKLILFLNRDWFNEFSTNKDLYTVSWRSKYVKALIKEFGTKISTGWAGSEKRNKQNLIKGHVLGALKNAGVIKGTNIGITRKALNIGVNPLVNEGDKIAPYMSHPQGDDESKQNPYIDWTLEYVENNS